MSRASFPDTDTSTQQSVRWTPLNRGHWRNTIEVYMLRTVLITLAIIGLAASAHAAKPSIPVHAWWSIPADSTSDARYRELAAIGFTTSMTPFPNADAAAKALDSAGKAGVKLFVTCPELSTDPEGTVRRFMNHPALAGWHLQDEPNAKDFPRLAAWAKRIQAVDAAHPCYINLFPTYANEQQLGTATYQAHVDSFVATVPVPFISFDHYPVTNEGPRPDWYENLEIISAAARKTGKPFWAFALSTALDPAYLVPTPAQLRMEVFSDLAYGASVIQYFTYWTPVSSEGLFHDAPIAVDGSRTPTYKFVRAMNRELQSYAKVFVGSRVVSIGHTGSEIPRGTSRFEPFAPFRDVTTGAKGAVVSRIENGGTTYLMVVNRDYQNEMPLSIGFDKNAKVKRIGKNGGKLAIKGGNVTGSVPPGDMAVFAVGK